ncbi:hypothetical protein SBV1_1640001 [Verrucomicrobia bacterium]|nr:hypothetical protein SBV1_1640001 [Verrucomicrobiota bacterium]
MDSGIVTNVASGGLADTEHAFYQVTVPGFIDGAPVLGWKLDLTALNGSASLRVRQNLVPDNTCDTTAYGAGTIIIAPPYLTPGTWYVDVQASGSTTFTLTSSAITTNALAHQLWTMPQVGQTNTAPGLALPAVGDSGIDTNGNPILDPQTGTVTDQGIDLKQGHFDVYAVVVPTTNAALLRTELQAISGNPNLYLRVGAAPTLNHGPYGSCNGSSVYDRSLTGGTTEYGNWVPLNGRYQALLTPRIWVMGVQAGGNANARYRLQLSCGNSVTNGLVQDLALNSGSFTNQNLNGGDWRYYRVQIPDPAPANWVVTWSRSLGSARLFVRDGSPPGDGNNPADFSNPSYNPGPWSSGQNQDLESWAGDFKNEGPYPRFDTPGTVTMSTPPLRPGSVYYLGFWSPVDTTFSVSSDTSGGPVRITNDLPFLGGFISNTIPAYGAMYYRMDVPTNATRILFNAANSSDVVLSLEQGTIANPGGPAHWTSYEYNNSQYPNQANAGLDQLLGTPNSWPWLPGYSYYLALTNTSATPEGFSINTAIPADLVPVAASAPTNLVSTRPNPAIEVVWEVTNEGTATASNQWYDTVWFSTDGVLDADSIDIGNFWISQEVPPGGSYGQTNTVTLPMTGSGNYTLFVQVDAGNSIYEANLDDKVSAPMNGTFTLMPPDLMPISASAPATVIATQANPSIQVAWAVTNQGIGAASGGWYDRVWFSTDGALDAQSVDIGDFYFDQIVLPNAGYEQTNSVTLPISLGGTYHYTLFVQVDIYNWLYESNKYNNISSGMPGTLVLELAPQIVTQPVNLAAPPANSVVFNVAAVGTPPIHYQWRFNNANLAGATSTALTLNNVQSTNTGNYLVVVTNAYGAATSAVANLLVALPGTNCTAAPAGLAAWWPGESNALDVMGDNDGVMTNGVAFAPGKVGHSFSFDGVASGVVVPRSSSIDLSRTPAWTIEAWVNPANVSSQNWPTILAQGHWTASLGLNNGTGKPESWINNDNQLVGTISLVLGQWSHLALVYDGTNRTFYVNGGFAGSGSAPSTSPDNSDLSIGNVFPNDSAGFAGQVDELSIYDRALSFDEIAVIYLAGSYGKCEDAPPTILTQPENQVTSVGSSVMFSVSAVGQQPLHYRWQKNGVNLTDTGDASGSSTSSLILTNSAAADVGVYAVVVSNAFGSVTSTGAVLSLDLVQNGGFEAGDLEDWTQTGNTSSTSVSSGSSYAHSGNYGLQVGPTGSLGYLSQTLPTVAGQTYLISFWLNSPGGNPNEFLVAWNGVILFDQTDLPNFGWTNMQFVVTAAGATSVLEFGFRKDPGYFGFDDVSVGALPVSILRLVAMGLATNGGFKLGVYGEVGQTYTLQGSTNLVNWTSLATFTCTNVPTYVVDSTAKNYRRRFYRLLEGSFPFTLGFGSAHPLSRQGLYLMLEGRSGTSYTIQASTNLMNWQVITNLVSTNSAAYFYDPAATNYTKRFYRAKVGP